MGKEITDNLTKRHNNVTKTCNDIDPNTGEPLGLRPHGKDFVRTNIVDTYIDINYVSYYLHYYYVTYGVPFINNN